MSVVGHVLAQTLVITYEGNIIEVHETAWANHSGLKSQNIYSECERATAGGAMRRRCIYVHVMARPAPLKYFEPNGRCPDGVPIAAVLQF